MFRELRVAVANLCVEITEVVLDCGVFGVVLERVDERGQYSLKLRQDALTKFGERLTTQKQLVREPATREEEEKKAAAAAHRKFGFSLVRFQLKGLSEANLPKAVEGGDQRLCYFRIV